MREVERTAGDWRPEVEECRRQLEVWRERGTHAEERAALLDGILAATPSLVFAYDRAGRYLYASPAGAQALGLRPEQMVGKTWRELGLPAATMESIDARREEVQATGQLLTAELDLATMGGRQHYECHFYPLRGPDGQAEGVVAAATDITARKQLLATAEEQRGLLEVVIENVPAGVVVLSWPELVYELANPAYRAFVPGKEVVGRTLRQVFPEIADQVEAIMQEVMRSRQPFRAVDMPFRLRRAPTGPLEETYFTFSYLPISTLEGRDAVLVLAVETTAEVQARRRIEELARVAQRRAAELDATLSAFAVGYTITDMAGRILHMNPAAENLFGYSRAERRLPVEERAKRLRVEGAAGKPLPPDELPERRALRGETVHGLIMAFHRPSSKTIWVSAGAAPIRLPEGELLGTVVSFTDVTAFRELQEERERLLQAEHRAREEAEAALRLRDEFLSVAAHELKTPLTSLRGQAELTMQRIAQGRIREVQQVRGALQVIDRQVDKLSTLVAQLLDISRIETGELELERKWVDLVPLAGRMVEAMQAGATRHTLSLQAPEALQAFVDSVRLEQVLYNLLDNAIRYSPKGGPVILELSLPKADTVRIAVRDYGIGVPPEQRERLFTRFFQAARRPAGGLGLGLYVSRRIVELHGGRIWAEFPEDGGSRFVVELPRNAGEAEGTEETEERRG